MPFTESMADFINPDTPGYVLATIGNASVDALFDDAYADQLNFASSAPALTVASTDVSSVAQDVAVVVNSVNYTVASIKPDGTGMTLLMLQEV